MSDWVPDPRPVPEALTEGFRPDPFTVADSISPESLDTLRRVTWRDTELGIMEGETTLI